MHRYACFHIRTIPQKSPPHLPPLSKVRCCRPKKFGRLPEGLSLHHPFSKPHYSSPRTKLASLVKGEVLSPEKIRATTGGIASRCTKPLRPYNHCKRTTHHRPTLNLPPLSKGGGLAARHKLLLCCVLLAICPPFLCYKLFCRQDGGIASRCTEPIYPHDHCKRTITPCSHQPFQNRTIPRKSPTPLPLNECSGSAISQKELSVAFYHSQN